jgi:hypothetical protein
MVSDSMRIFEYQGFTLLNVEHTHTREEWFVGLQDVTSQELIRNVLTVILKIAAVENDRLETAVCSSSATDAIDRHEVLRGLSVGRILILVRYRASFFTAIFCLIETPPQSSKHTSVWMMSTRIRHRPFPCRSTANSNMTGTEDDAVFFVSVLHWSFCHNWPLLCAVLSEHNLTTRHLSWWRKEFCPIWRWHVSVKLSVWNDACFITSAKSFNSRKPVGEFHFTGHAVV